MSSYSIPSMDDEDVSITIALAATTGVYVVCVHVHASMHVCMSVCVRMCMCARTCVYIHVCVHAHVRM